MKNIVMATAVVIALVTSAIATLSMMQLRASNTLLRKISLLKPGISLSSVSNQLGTMMYEISDLNRMIDLGSIKDPTFCRDKKLFWFNASTPPCRALEIYTDTNNTVVYVSWQGL